MESSLPFAVRIAAGLLSEAVGRARRLPADLTALPVSVIGQVAKFSFELNQQLAELATEGDRLLAGLRSSEEPPQRTAWSTIDDEDEVAARDPQAAATWDATPADAQADPTPTTASTPTTAEAVPGLVLDDEVAVPAPSPRLVPDPDAPTTRPVTTAPAAPEPSTRRPRATGKRVGSAGDPAGDRVGTSMATSTSTIGTAGSAGTAGTARTGPTGTSMDRALVGDIEELEVERPAPPVGLPSSDHHDIDISTFTVSQLRSRVRSWNSEQVRAALEQEQREKARPAFLTVLTNRLSTLARGGA